MKKAGVIGITGKVGSLVAKIIANNSRSDFSNNNNNNSNSSNDNSNLELVGGISSKSTNADIEEIVGKSDVLIDFSLPSATLKVIDFAVQCKVPFVCGTTGFSEDDFAKIKECANKIPILYASNFSLSIQLMASLLKKCSETLAGYDISIIDKHHKNKKDAPSGTSLFLAKQIGRNVQMLSVRSGNMPAEMICDFCSEDEMLTISHRAFGRAVFAKGAIACAKWIIGNEPKMYSMQDYIANNI